MEEQSKVVRHLQVAFPVLIKKQEPEDAEKSNSGFGVGGRTVTSIMFSATGQLRYDDGKRIFVKIDTKLSQKIEVRKTRTAV